MNVSRIGVVALAAAAAGAALGAGLPRPAASSHPAIGFAQPSPLARASPAAARLVVYVAGSVNHPGVYRLANGARAIDALQAAGDAKPDADLVGVNLAEPLTDGEEVAVPAKGEHPATARRANGAHHSSARKHGHRGRKRSAPRATPLDLNSADAASLAALPGIGAGLAARIVAFREANGPFESVDALADVAGITERRLEELVPYLTVRP